MKSREDLMIEIDALLEERNYLKAKMIDMQRPLRECSEAGLENTNLIYDIEEDNQSLKEAVNKLHIGLVARGNYIGSVTYEMVEELKNKYRF